ncbi:PKD domain-containing protein [Methanosarcina barkeri]|uniref:Cell surface protein n=1 Tax=Methanosarcina barkeri CM1 TaxID=796385 RepID=A0A0G3C7G0_METBA|nr:PKD domain-containing protein [Methanosarcina barkeri]AKJ37934.1 cell surface protein [Methanosarcina barkeri CM1]
MKKKLVVVIAAILMLALTVSTVSAEDSLNSTIDSVSVNEGNNLMTSDTTSLHQEAVTNAKKLISVGYLWGGKGFDYKSKKYADASMIISGYTYYDPDTGKTKVGTGVDCSGLVMWSFNKAYGATKYQDKSNPIYYEGAAGQWSDSDRFQQKSTSVPTKDNLTVGDLLFIGTKNKKTPDHVGMYVGDGKVIHSKGSTGVEIKTLDDWLDLPVDNTRKYRDCFTGYGSVVVTSSNANVMLVIDRSGSMYGTPISNAKNAASLFVDYMEPDDMAGVVSFSTSARYDHHLTTLTNDNKSSIKDKIGKISASGNTAIGSGLRYGLNDLLAYGDSSTPQAIVLLSDGLQNSGEHPNKVIPDITDNKIKVYTVGLGSNADEGLLGDIATKTGGKYYYSPTENQLQNIYNDIVGEVTGLTPIKDLTFNMVKGDHTFIAYKTDSTMKKAIASVFWPGSNVDLVLHKPDGSIVDPSEAESDPDIEYIASSTYKIYKVSNPELGEWTMELTATDMPTGGEDVSVTVRAESTLSMSLSTDKDQYIQGESVKITSGISNGETKITTADVKSNITLPDSSINHLTLYDDGSHGDGGAKDGIYANFFDNTSLKGDYTVDATATGSLSDGSQFNRIEDSSFKIIQGTNSILLLPDNLSIEGKTGEKITKNITVSTSQALTSVAITPTSLQSENGDIIDTSNIKVNPAAVNVSSGVPETILVTINIPESATSGNYTGKINAIGTNGSDSCTIHLHVTDDNVTDTVPVANFTSSATSGKAPLKVKFTDTSTGSPTSWFWNFGDGSKSFHQNPIHKYSKAGIYTVNLTVKNDIGRNTVTKTEYINVITKPVANFTSSATSGKAPLKVKFTDTSTGTPAAWKWDFGDGSKSFHQNPTHKYSNAGVYNVSLKVKNAAGSNTVTKTNYIKVITKPVASFTSNVTSGKAPLKVTFTDTSTGIPAKWKWSFGDGTISREQNPEHQYLQGGSYKVTLTVSNAAGGNTITKTNYIKVTTNTRPGIYSENK